MARPRVSVALIALNEGRRIARCLESVRWADEIVVVDGGSADDTAQVARRFTDRVFARPFTDFSEQKNFAADQTSGEWVLSLDADEEVTEKLKEEILATLSAASCLGYRLRRRSLMFGRWMCFSGTQNDRPLRLFRRGMGRFERPIHETLSVDGPVGELKGTLNHYTYDSLGDYLRKLNSYTSREAAFLKSQGARAPGGPGLWARWLAMFFRLYVTQQGFRDGFAGFLFSFLSGYYIFVKFQKLSELRPR